MKVLKLESGKNVPYLEITEVALVCCNILNTYYQQNSRVLYTFVPNKLFGQLLDVFPKKCIFLKTFDSKFLYAEIWFTDQKSNPLEIEKWILITLLIN